MEFLFSSSLSKKLLTEEDRNFHLRIRRFLHRLTSEFLSRLSSRLGVIAAATQFLGPDRFYMVIYPVISELFEATFADTTRKLRQTATMLLARATYSILCEQQPHWW